MFFSMLTNWKTTLAGLLGAVVLIAPQLQHCLAGVEPCNYGQIVLGLLMAIFGLVAKDHNVTGVV